MMQEESGGVWADPFPASFILHPFIEEWMHVMMELQVTLDFTCCGCEKVVTVTVQCAGKWLGGNSLAAVKVPCPDCSTINQLSFRTNGTVQSVQPCTCYRPLPEPSVN
jgi:phage FluMu protein Com